MRQFRGTRFREIIDRAAADCNQVTRSVIVTLLIVHGLVGVALLGALTHQCASFVRAGTRNSFAGRYTAVAPRGFVTAVVVLYVAEIATAALLYPSYRLDVRIPFEEMSLGWAVGLFELKEHAGGIALGMLPAYAFLWSRADDATLQRARNLVTILLAAVVWFDFLVGHVLNNIRGLG